MRLSLNRRLEAIREAAARIDPVAAAVYRMQPATRLRHDLWRSECNRIVDEMGGGEALYAHYLDTGEWPLPDPPRSVRDALSIEDAPTIPHDMSAADVAEVYARMIEG